MSVGASAGCWWTSARLVSQQGLHAKQAAQQGILRQVLRPGRHVCLLLLLSSKYCRQHAKQQRLPQTCLLL